MNNIAVAVFGTLCGLAPVIFYYAHTSDMGGVPHALATDTTPIERCFRPGPISCEALVVKEIDSATRTIEFEAYSLTDKSIIDALNRAAARGVSIRSVVDRTSLLAGLLPGQVYTDCSVRIMHNKTLIIDHESVGTGSFNFSYSAERANAENHIVIHNAAEAGAYLANFDVLVSASQRGFGCQ